MLESYFTHIHTQRLVCPDRSSHDGRMLGVYNYQRLPIDAVPDITNVQVQINTQAVGYSPMEAEQRVTFPIERVMAGLPNLEYTRSISRYGLSQVTVIFKDGTDIYFARQLVNQRIQEAKDMLPPESHPQWDRSPLVLVKSLCTQSKLRKALKNQMEHFIPQPTCEKFRTGSSNHSSEQSRE